MAGSIILPKVPANEFWSNAVLRFLPSSSFCCGFSFISCSYLAVTAAIFCLGPYELNTHNKRLMTIIILPACNTKIFAFSTMVVKAFFHLGLR